MNNNDSSYWIETQKLSNKKDFAICYVGGGIRETIFTYCSIAGIKNKYNFNNIKYLSSCSGSSIFCILFYYYDSIYLFDQYNEPNQCYLNILKKKSPNTFGTKLSNISNIQLIKEMFELVVEKKNGFPSWINLINNVFFNEENIELCKQTDTNKPYYIITGSAYYVNLNKIYFPIEFTCDYCNLPIVVKDNNDKYLYGGFMSELDNFCAKKVISPIVQCGISSNFINAKLEFSTGGKFDTYEWEIINPISKTIDKLNFVDGGIYDNVSLISCLRRKVKNIHLNIFTQVSILDKNFTNNLDESGYFKYFEGNDSSNNFTIFTKETWNKLYSELLDKFNKGKPLIVLVTTEILSNEYLQLESYGPINFLFHLNSNNFEWYSQLPIETQQYIKHEYTDFPYFSFLKYNFDSVIINLIYSLINWEILNSQEYETFYLEL